MSGITDIQNNNEQLLNEIQTLQQLEQRIFNNLESNPNLTSEQQQKLIDQMNNFSNMRINLYQTLSNVNNFFENALNNSVGSLKQQATAISIVENELNKSKERLELLEEERNNKFRMIEINTYFGEKYAEHTTLMKILICILIPVVILSLLHKKGILPQSIYYGLIVLVSLIGGYFFWKRFMSIVMRDNMNYQEYNWAFYPPSTSNATTTSTSSDPWLSTSSHGTCVGDSCCSSGLTYDTTTNQCVNASANTTSTTTESFITTETMVNNILTKKQLGKYKTDYDLRQPKPINL